MATKDILWAIVISNCRPERWGWLGSGRIEEQKFVPIGGKVESVLRRVAEWGRQSGLCVGKGIGCKKI